MNVGAACVTISGISAPRACRIEILALWQLATRKRNRSRSWIKGAVVAAAPPLIRSTGSPTVLRRELSPVAPAEQPFGGFATDFTDDESDDAADARPTDREEFGGWDAGYEGDPEASDPLGSYGLAAYVTGLIASDAWQKMGSDRRPEHRPNCQGYLEQARFSIDCTAAIIGSDRAEARRACRPNCAAICSGF